MSAQILPDHVRRCLTAILTEAEHSELPGRFAGENHKYACAFGAASAKLDLIIGRVKAHLKVWDCDHVDGGES